MVKPELPIREMDDDDMIVRRTKCCWMDRICVRVCVCDFEDLDIQMDLYV